MENENPFIDEHTGLVYMLIDFLKVEKELEDKNSNDPDKEVFYSSIFEDTDTLAF